MQPMTSVAPGEPRRKSRREPTQPVSTTIADACRITGLGKSTIYELIREGKLKAVAVGRRRLVLFTSIMALVEPGE